MNLTGLKAIEASDPAMITQLKAVKKQNQKNLLNYIMKTDMQLIFYPILLLSMRQITKKCKCICSLQYVRDGVLGECV